MASRSTASGCIDCRCVRQMRCVNALIHFSCACASVPVAQCCGTIWRVLRVVRAPNCDATATAPTSARLFYGANDVLCRFCRPFYDTSVTLSAPLISIEISFAAFVIEIISISVLIMCSHLFTYLTLSWWMDLHIALPNFQLVSYCFVIICFELRLG